MAVAELDLFGQILGVTLGNRLSSLLFLAVMNDLTSEIKKRHPLVNLVLYFWQSRLYRQ